MRISRIKGFLLTALACSFILIGCETDNNPFQLDYTLAEALLFDQADAISTEVRESGLTIHVLENGSGINEVVARDNITIYYTIRFKPTNDIIESSYANNVTLPLQFSGIANASSTKGDGFVEGILGMKEDEKRILIIPPDISVYSDTVIVDVELDSILY